MGKITRLISIDSSSSKTGWAVFDNGEYQESGLIDLSKEKDSDHRIELMCKKIIQLLKEKSPSIVVIEKLNVGRNMVALPALCKVIGVVYCYSILSNDVFYYEIQPSQWRSKLGMQANGRKRDEYKKLSIQYAKKIAHKNITDDEADAICIGQGFLKNE